MTTAVDPSTHFSQVLAGSQSISSHHCKLVIDASARPVRATLYDAGSRNGTFVNEQRVVNGGSVRLKSGDALRFGYDAETYRFYFPADAPREVVGGGADAEPAPLPPSGGRRGSSALAPSGSASRYASLRSQHDASPAAGGAASISDRASRRSSTTSSRAQAELVGGGVAGALDMGQLAFDSRDPSSPAARLAARRASVVMDSEPQASAGRSGHAGVAGRSVSGGASPSRRPSQTQAREQSNPPQRARSAGASGVARRERTGVPFASSGGGASATGGSLEHSIAYPTAQGRRVRSSSPKKQGEWQEEAQVEEQPKRTGRIRRASVVEPMDEEGGPQAEGGEEVVHGPQEEGEAGADDSLGGPSPSAYAPAPTDGRQQAASARGSSRGPSSSRLERPHEGGREASRGREEDQREEPLDDEFVEQGQAAWGDELSSPGLVVAPQPAAASRAAPRSRDDDDGGAQSRQASGSSSAAREAPRARQSSGGTSASGHSRAPSLSRLERPREETREALPRDEGEELPREEGGERPQMQKRATSRGPARAEPAGALPPPFTEFVQERADEARPVSASRTPREGASARGRTSAPSSFRPERPQRERAQRGDDRSQPLDGADASAEEEAGVEDEVASPGLVVAPRPAAVLRAPRSREDAGDAPRPRQPSASAPAAMGRTVTREPAAEEGEEEGVDDPADGRAWDIPSSNKPRGEPPSRLQASLVRERRARRERSAEGLPASVPLSQGARARSPSRPVQRADGSDRVEAPRGEEELTPHPSLALSSPGKDEQEELDRQVEGGTARNARRPPPAAGDTPPSREQRGSVREAGEEEEERGEEEGDAPARASSRSRAGERAARASREDERQRERSAAPAIQSARGSVQDEREEEEGERRDGGRGRPYRSFQEEGAPQPTERGSLSMPASVEGAGASFDLVGPPARGSSYRGSISHGASVTASHASLPTDGPRTGVAAAPRTPAPTHAPNAQSSEAVQARVSVLLQGSTWSGPGLPSPTSLLHPPAGHAPARPSLLASSMPHRSEATQAAAARAAGVSTWNLTAPEAVRELPTSPARGPFHPRITPSGNPTRSAAASASARGVGAVIGGESLSSSIGRESRLASFLEVPGAAAVLAAGDATTGTAAPDADHQTEPAPSFRLSDTAPRAAGSGERTVLTFDPHAGELQVSPAWNSTSTLRLGASGTGARVSLGQGGDFTVNLTGLEPPPPAGDGLYHFGGARAPGGTSGASTLTGIGPFMDPFGSDFGSSPAHGTSKMRLSSSPARDAAPPGQGAQASTYNSRIRRECNTAADAVETARAAARTVSPARSTGSAASSRGRPLTASTWPATLRAQPALAPAPAPAARPAPQDPAGGTVAALLAQIGQHSMPGGYAAALAPISLPRPHVEGPMLSVTLTPAHAAAPVQQGRTTAVALPAEAPPLFQPSGSDSAAHALAINAILATREEQVRRLLGAADEQLVRLSHIATGTLPLPPSAIPQQVGRAVAAGEEDDDDGASVASGASRRSSRSRSSTATGTRGRGGPNSTAQARKAALERRLSARSEPSAVGRGTAWWVGGDGGERAAAEAPPQSPPAGDSSSAGAWSGPDGRAAPAASAIRPPPPPVLTAGDLLGQFRRADAQGGPPAAGAQMLDSLRGGTGVPQAWDPAAARQADRMAALRGQGMGAARSLRAASGNLPPAMASPGRAVVCLPLRPTSLHAEICRGAGYGY